MHLVLCTDCTASRARWMAYSDKAGGGVMERLRLRCRLVFREVVRFPFSESDIRAFWPMTISSSESEESLHQSGQKWISRTGPKRALYGFARKRDGRHGHRRSVRIDGVQRTHSISPGFFLVHSGRPSPLAVFADFLR